MTGPGPGRLESESEIAQSCPCLCDPMDCSLPGFSIHRIFKARILEWVAISFSRDLPYPEIEPASPALAGFFTTEPSGKPQKIISEDPINTSELGEKKKIWGD